MYNYELFMSGYDGNVKIFLQHYIQFTQEQFQDLVSTVFTIIIKGKIHDSNLRHEVFDEPLLETIWGEDVFSEVYDSLINLYGFKNTEFSATFGIIDYANFLNKEETTFDKNVELIKSKLCKQ